MRDEDLAKLPQTVERWKFAEMLEALGFGRDAQNNLKGFVVSTDAVRAVVYATDESGQRMSTREMDQILVHEMGQKEASFVEGDWRPVAVTHEISIPLVGKWKRPEEATQPCGSVGPEGVEVCELPEAHYFCRSGGTSWPHPGSPARMGRGNNSGPDDPDDAVQDCEAWEAREGYSWQCAMPLGHEGEHSYRNNTGWMLRDAPQA